MKNLLNERIETLEKVINEIGMHEEIEVNEELAYSIFGDNLDIENSEEELKEMFLFEL